MAASPGQRIGLAALGIELLRRDRAFHPRRYGHTKLLPLIRSLDAGTLGVDASGIHWTLSVIGTTELETMAADALEGGSVHVDPSWWRVVTASDDDHQAWYDLCTESLCTDQIAVQTEPERYLHIPRLDAATLANGSTATTDATMAGSTTPSMATAPEARTRQELQRARAGRRAAAVEALERWSRRHGVDPRTWIAKHVPPTTAKPPRADLRPSPVGLLDNFPGALPRALIQAWLDACSDAELDAIVASITPLSRLHETLREAVEAKRRG